MEHVVPRGMAAALAAAVAAAGLIAVTPTTPAALPLPPQHIDVQLTDVFSAVSTNIGNIFTDLGNSLTADTQLHLGVALNDFFGAGVNTVFIAQNLIKGALEALTGNSSQAFFESLTLPAGPDILGTLAGLLTVVGEQLVGGVQSLFSLNLTGAFAEFSGAFDYGVLGIPAELVVGPLMLLGL